MLYKHNAEYKLEALLMNLLYDTFRLSSIVNVKRIIKTQDTSIIYAELQVYVKGNRTVSF